MHRSVWFKRTSNIRSANGIGRFRVVLALFSAMFLLAVAGSTAAVADQDAVASDEAGVGSLPPWLSRAGVEAALEESDPSLLEGPETDPDAAGFLAHEDLDRGEAIDLLTGVFGEVLEQPSALYADLDIRAYRSNYAAVTEPGDSQQSGDQTPPGLVTSILPLRAENEDGTEEAVDLNLKRSEGELQPRNPLVEVGIPTEIGEGISLPEANVTIELHGAPAQRAASEADVGAAIYPNVAEDSDLAVAPSPTGVETFTQLRSGDAPRTQEFTLGMPPGAVLERTASGGAEIRQGDSALMTVRPPSAIDANGDEVPVSLDVEGNTLAIHTSPTEDSVYPILVDPIWETYYWDYYPGAESPEWIPYDSGSFNASWAAWMVQGLKMWSPQGWVTPGDQASWNYYVPRFFTDFGNPQIHERPTSYIREITFSDLMFVWGSGTQNDPHLQMGLWSENKGNWVSLAMRWGYEGPLNSPGYVYRLTNPAEVTDAKNGGVALATWENYLPPQRNVSVGMATAEISDKDSPEIAWLESPTTWVNQTAAPVTYSTTDKGLGIYQLRVEQPNPTSGMTTFITSVGCDGSARNPCPRSVVGPPGILTYEPKSMSEGEKWLKLTAVDPITHQSPVSEFRVKVDHSAPTVALSGTMTEQATLGTRKGQYTVKVASTDGTVAEPRSGVAKIAIKVDGKAISLDSTWSPGCATKNCALTKEWTLNADQYVAGQHKVEVTATDAVGLSTLKTLTIETHPDLTAPAVSLAGSMTEQATLGTTRPSYLLKINAADPGSTEERQSGVASTVIKVDGSTVDSSSPGCSAGGCSIAREWTLNSLSYAVGAHSVQVTATDAAGKPTTKTLTVNIARDQTAPQLSATNSFYTAPEGWLEQKALNYNATASDPNGYGITSLILKIDGGIVKGVSQTCPLGSCTQSFGAVSLNMAGYDGGEHPAELIATDGAGNVKKKSWMIRIDPKGAISPGEAEDTLEAVEATSPVNLLGPSEEEEGYEGTTDGLEWIEGESEFLAEGAVAPTEIAEDPADGLTVDVPVEDALDPGCNEPEVEPKVLTPIEEDELAEHPPGNCVPVGEREEAGANPVEITPVITGGAAGSVTLADGQVGAVTPNQQSSVDLVTRPLYDGAMTFTTIRDATAPEQYSWKVRLSEDQEVKLLDSTHAAVYYSEGHPAFAINAVPAHDAIGSTVQTTLSVSEGKYITLTVNHHASSPAGGSFIYPVVAGAGWEGGFQTYQIAMPPPIGEEEEEEGEGQVSHEGVRVPSLKLVSSGPPVLQRASAPADGLTPVNATRSEKKFKFTYCVPRNLPADPIFDGQAGSEWFNVRRRPTGEAESKNLPQIVSECQREDFEGVYWGVSVHGRFHYIEHHWVWQFPNEWDCNKWGEEQPAKVNCKVLVHEETHGNGNVNAVHGPMDVIGEFRFPLMKGQWGVETRAPCFTEGGRLYPNPRQAAGPYERPMIWEVEYIIARIENCEWR
jgi:hypothetical protein